MASNIGEVLRQERERREMTQRELAKAVHVDRSLISNWELGKVVIPLDILCRIIKVLGSSKLGMQACFECQINTLTMPYLDLVDMHPMTVVSVMLEELQEASAALQGLRLANKRSMDDLTPQDRQAMTYAGEQVIDLLAGINTLLSGWQEHYGFDVNRQAAAGYEKLFTKGYATRQSYDAWECIA